MQGTLPPATNSLAHIHIHVQRGVGWCEVVIFLEYLEYANRCACKREKKRKGKEREEEREGKEGRVRGKEAQLGERKGRREKGEGRREDARRDGEENGVGDIRCWILDIRY